MCSGAGRDRTLAGFYVLCLQLVGAAFMAARGRPQGWPLRPDTLGRACSAEVNAPGRGSRFILGWRVFHGNLFGSVFLSCLRRAPFCADRKGRKSRLGRGDFDFPPSQRPSPFLAVLRGGVSGRGKSESPAPTRLSPRFLRQESGAAGGMTRKQIQKGVTWKARRPGAGRADVGIGPLRKADGGDKPL